MGKNYIKDYESLEVYSFIITMIYRDEYYTQKLKIKAFSEIITCKNRNGPLGTVKLFLNTIY